MIKRLLSVLFLVMTIFAFTVGEITAEASTVSLGEVVIERDTKRLLWGKDELKKLPMASTTKIMTAIMIIEDCDLDQTFIIPQEAVGIEGSSVYLKKDEEYSVKELLYGLMLRSGNDCATALAIYHSGNVRSFVDRMNERSKEYGAEYTHFMNPHGLPNADHYTTAYDLAVIASHALQNDTFREIVSTKYFSARGWKNKNKMLERFDGAMGVKTGFTTNAGRCLVTAAERDGMTIVSVVLNSPEMYERSADLLEYCFSKYQLKTLFSPYERFGKYAVIEGFKYPLSETESKNVKIKLIEPNIGESIGKIEIYLEKDLLFSQNLYMMER